METPIVEPIRNGWAAYGKGWAVRGESPDDARARFFAEARLRAEIDRRPHPASAYPSGAYSP